MFRQHLAWYTIYIMYINSNMVRSCLFHTSLVQQYCVTCSVLMDEIHFPGMERKPSSYKKLCKINISEIVSSALQTTDQSGCRTQTNHIVSIWVIYCHCINCMEAHWSRASWGLQSCYWRFSCQNYHCDLKILCVMLYMINMLLLYILRIWDSIIV